MSDLKEYARIEADISASLEGFKQIVLKLENSKLEQSANMAMQAASQLHGFAIKPLEQSANAIVGAQQQAINNALNGLNQAQVKIEESTSFLENIAAILNERKINFAITGVAAICGLAFGVGVGAYMAWDYAIKDDSAKIQNIANQYQQTNQVLTYLQQHNIKLQIEQDENSTYISTRKDGNAYKTNKGFLVIQVPK